MLWIIGYTMLEIRYSLLACTFLTVLFYSLASIRYFKGIYEKYYITLCMQSQAIILNI